MWIDVVTDLKLGREIVVDGPTAITNSAPTLRIEKLQIIRNVPGKAQMGNHFAPYPFSYPIEPIIYRRFLGCHF